MKIKDIMEARDTNVLLDVKFESTSKNSSIDAYVDRKVKKYNGGIVDTNETSTHKTHTVSVPKPAIIDFTKDMLYAFKHFGVKGSVRPGSPGGGIAL